MDNNTKAEDFKYHKIISPWIEKCNFCYYMYILFCFFISTMTCLKVFIYLFLMEVLLYFFYHLSPHYCPPPHTTPPLQSPHWSPPSFSLDPSISHLPAQNCQAPLHLRVYLYVACEFSLFIRFHIWVKSYGIYHSLAYFT